MSQLRKKVRTRFREFTELVAAMRQSREYLSSCVSGNPIFHIEKTLRRRSLLRIMDTRIFQFSYLAGRSNKKRLNAYNRWVETGFTQTTGSIRYQGRGFQLELPQRFLNAATIIVNDLREIYLENRYSCLLPFGQAVHDGDVVIDCGANIGAFAILAASQGPRVRVLAFEPEPSTFETLCRNVELNGMTPQVKCYQCGVAAREGSYVLARNESSFTMHRLVNPDESVDSSKLHLATEEQIVRCVSIDQILGEVGIGRCDVIKMDVEGAERSALRGAADTIRHYKPRLTIAAYHHPSDAFVLPVLIKNILPGYNILVSREAHLYAFI